MRVRNPGPRADLPALGLMVDQGETVEVPDEIAASLIEQGWTKGSAARKPTAAKAASEPDTPEPTPDQGTTKEGDD